MLKTILFPPIKLKRLNDPSVRLFSKIGYIVDSIIWFFVVTFLLFWGYMQLFYDSVNSKYIQIYTPNKQNIEEFNGTLTIVDNAYNYLETSVAVCRNNTPPKHKVYLVNSDLLYKLISPINIINKTYALNILGSSFYGKVDLKRNIAYETKKKHERFDLILLHEMVHSCQYNRYGLISSLISYFPHKWVYEGYPTYIMSKYLHTDIENLKVSDDYIRFAKAVKHAIEKMHYSVDKLHKGEVDYDTVYKDMHNKN